MLELSHIKALVSSGCTVEQLASLVEADISVEHEKRLARRAAGRQRQRRYIEKLKQNQQSYDASLTVSDRHPPLPPCPPLDKENTPTPLKEINPPLNPPTPISLEADFERFWEGYPNRVGKKAAAKAFALAKRRSSIDQIMAGLARYVAKTDDRPWCNPATWLSQDRWEDQPAQVQFSAKPLSFREANTIRNQEMINAALGSPRPANYPAARQSDRPALGAPTLRVVSQLDCDDFNF